MSDINELGKVITEIISDSSNASLRLSELSHSVNRMIQVINQAIGGTTTGKNQEIINRLKNAQECMERALKHTTFASNAGKQWLALHITSNAGGTADSTLTIVEEIESASSTNSYERSQSDSVVVQQLSKLDSDLIAKVPERRRSALHTAYAEASGKIVNVVNRFASSLIGIHDSGFGFNESGEYVKLDSYYSPHERQIAMNERMTNDEYTDVFKHEYGHFVDDMMGGVSGSQNFIDALQGTAETFNPETVEGRTRLCDMLDDAFSTGACFDRNVTDIISALLLNNPIVVERFKKEGVAYYQHNSKYWRSVNPETGQSYHMPCKETFANMFAIETDGYRISSNFVERWFPEIVSEFERLLDGGL